MEFTQESVGNFYFWSAMNESRKFAVGDKVSFLHETGSGVIVSIEEGQAIVKMEDGFDIPFPLSELVKSDMPIHTPPAKEKKNKKDSKKETEAFNWDTPKHVIQKQIDKDFSVDPEWVGEKKSKTGKVDCEPDCWETDLHIEELVDDYRHLSNGEMLEIQLQHLRRFVLEAMDKRIRKLIIIHGVGTGRLKQEVYAELMRYTNLEFFDASFKLYGRGATEVRIYYGKGR